MTSSLKNQLRSEMKILINSLNISTIKDQSSLQQAKVMGLKCYKESKVISVYLPMPKELQTYEILENAFSNGKRVFVPKVTGSKPNDMIMIELDSIIQLNSFSRSKWGIPEPPIEMVKESNCDILKDIDLVLLPGVAYDKNCNRLGHGKGYYDYFLEKLQKSKIENSLPKATLIGLSLNEQLIDTKIPMESHDTQLDYVVTPQKIFKKV